MTRLADGESNDAHCCVRAHVRIIAAGVLACLVPGCVNDGDADQGRVTLKVAAAANLKFVFGQIEAEFEEAHPDINLEITYGSSGSFFAQLSQRAPFDIFFSADTKYPRQLVDDGHAADNGYFPYAQGRLVIWVPNDSSLDIESQGIECLVDASVRKIAIANITLAPYGQAAVAAMKSLDVYDRAKDRIVQGENIAQTAHFVESRAADVGIIALSLALIPQMKQNGRYWEIPTDSYEPIVQAGVIVSASQRTAAAETLRAFVVGERGQELFEQYGYATVAE